MANYSLFSLVCSLISSLCLLFLLLPLPLLSSIALIAGHFEFCNEPSHPHPSASPLAGTSLAELVAASCGVSSLFCLPLFSLLPLHVMLRAPLIPAVVQLLLPLQVILSDALIFPSSRRTRSSQSTVRAWRRYSRESMHPICACASGRSPKRLHRRTWWDAEEFDVTSRSQVPAAVTAGSCCGHDDSAGRVVYSIDGQVELEQLSHAQRVLCCMDWLSPWL